MSNEDLRALLAVVEVAYTRRLLRAWNRDPESFPDYVKQLGEIIDLRRKVWP